MTVPTDLRHSLTRLASTAHTERVPNWSASIGIVVAGSDWLTCRAGADGVEILDSVGTVDTTLHAIAEDPVRRWLINGVDFTHLVRAGDMAIDGSYFDILLLSKVLGLRPDRREMVK